MLYCIRIRAGAVAGALLAVLPRPSLAAETPEAGHEHTEEIVVTATPLDRAPDDLAMPVDTFDRDHLLEHMASSLGETLAREPGIATTGFAPGASNPVIRGQGSFRVRTLENGIGTHDVSMLSDDHGLPTHPLVQQRVEVIRGPATLRYGGGAIAGAIDSFSDRVPHRLRERPIEAELFGAYGTNADARDGAFMLDGSTGEFAWHLDGLSRDSNDYQLPSDDDEFNTETDGDSLAAGAAWIGGRGRLGFGVARFTDEYGIPAPEDPAEPISIDMESDRYMLEGDLLEPVPAISTIRLRGAFTDYSHDELENDTIVGSSFDNEQYEGRLEVLHEPLGGATGALGFHVGKRDLEASGEGGALLFPSKTRTLALYLFEELPIGQRLTLQLGARGERTELEGTDFQDRERERRFTPFSGSAGLVIDLSDAASLGVTATASQRAPDTLELFARGPHHASETFEIGDSSLDEERVWSFDLDLRTRLERFRGNISVFYMDYSNFTWGRFTGDSWSEDGTTEFANDPDLLLGDLREVTFSQADAWFWGGEAEGHVDLLDLAGGTLGADASLDYVRSEVDRENSPRIPPLRLGAGISFSHPRVRARVGVRRVEDQDRLGAFETETGAYTQFEASLIAPLGEHLELSLTGSNLNDEVARNHVSLKKEDVVLPGRDLRIALRATF
jgi:iron complex outermembrane receptor protein